MTEKEAFDAWAPPDAAWSAWAKPVAFVNLRHVHEGATPERLEAEPSPAGIDAATAVVVDLPGPRAVAKGLALARSGWQPVPLFNGNLGPAPVVELTPLLRALRAGAEELRASPPPRDAPPAFLLDAARMGGGQTPRAGEFDNRWVTFPQDFPSASYLAERGIRRVLVVQDGDRIAEDLTHVLLRYREGSLEVLLLRDLDSPPVPATLVKPSRFRSVWYRLLATLGLHRSMGGGFGGVVPDPQRAG